MRIGLISFKKVNEAVITFLLPSKKEIADIMQRVTNFLIHYQISITA